MGIYNVEIKLHPEVSKDIKLNVARTEEEALIQDKTGKAVVESKEENDDDNIYKKYKHSVHKHEPRCNSL